MTQQSQETVLPPKNGHHADKQSNGTTQRLASPYDTEANLAGFCETSAKLCDDVANGLMEHPIAKQANAAISNGIASIKTQVSLVRAVDRLKDPALLRVAADMMGGASGKRFLELAATRNEQRQIAADKSSGAASDKSDQGRRSDEPENTSSAHSR
jgi:hypothetical protein